MCSLENIPDYLKLANFFLFLETIFYIDSAMFFLQFYKSGFLTNSVVLTSQAVVLLYTTCMPQNSQSRLRIIHGMLTPPHCKKNLVSISPILAVERKPRSRF
jgi:hypothetical protein